MQFLLTSEVDIYNLLLEIISRRYFTTLFTLENNNENKL